MVWTQLLVDWAHLALLTIALGTLLHELGMLSLGHAGLVLVGGYALALVATGGVSPIATLAVASLITVVIASAALRVRDDIFAVVTLAMGEVLRLVVLGAQDLTGGSLGLGPLPRTDWLASDVGAGAVGLATLLLVAAAYVLVLSRWPGLVFGAIRDGEMGIRSLGVATASVRFSAVVVTGCVGWLVGFLQVGYFGLATPRMGSLDVSLQAIAAAMVAWPFWRQGRPLATVGGLLLGAALLVVLPALLRQFMQGNADVAVIRQAMFGALLFALVHPRCPTSRVFAR